MKKLIFLLLLSTPLLGSCQFFDRVHAEDKKPSFHSEKTDVSQDPKVIGARRQITQVGPRSGESYFSPDGSKLILQSERFEGNPFYQIYSLDLKSGRSELLSTGKGKTTCAWYHPSMTKALYSSTHLDPDLKKKAQEEFDTRKSGQKAKYSWSYDDTYDIFEVNLKTKAQKRLTTVKGYDAEASYSPDGQWILFASNRTGYTEKLPAEDQKLFEQDPSSQMELYIMKSDGTNVKRLTNHLGYDGGPFFSHDGKKITWRRFTPNGASAEIWTMNVDGSDPKELTHWKAMSWAPFYHPSGDYIIFTSNKLGYSNFELFIVDAAGTKEPVRVSYWDGFDGLPVFSPDGQKLAWTHRDEKGESQVFLADWDDAKARSLLGLGARAPRGSDLLGDFNPHDGRTIVSYLASQELGGRLTGSPEEIRLNRELGVLMKDLGLKPGWQNTYTQEFEFTSGVDAGSGNEVVLSLEGKEQKLKQGDDFMPLSFSKSGAFEAAGIAFAGYGLVAPANEKQPEYNSYKDLDVKGKWVLAFREIPEEVPNQRRIFLNQVSRLHHKALVAKQAGAVGLILVSGPNSTAKQKILKLRFDGSFAEAGLPVLSVSDDVAEKLLKSTGRSLKSWQSELDQGVIKGEAELKNVRLGAKVDLIEKKSTGRNTLGMISVPGAKQTLVIGAHGDHLGKGESGSSLAKGAEQGQVHVGADDNASGVAALFMVAQQMQKAIKAGTFKPKQNILFAVWSGEEIGLLGSSAFLRMNKAPLSAYLNMDMVGRLRDTLLVQGAGSALEWRSILEPLAVSQKVSISIQNDPYVPSDAMVFYVKGVPTIMFFTGVHTEYHTPRDTAETINYEGLAEIARLMTSVGQSIAAGQDGAQKPVKLTYQKVESSHQKLEGRSFRVYLGTIPDYAQEKVKGVLISGTSKDSPAEKAGLKSGDVIKGMAGTKIDNIYDYVYVLQSLKPNQKVPVEVFRQEKTLTLELTPVLKE